MIRFLLLSGILAFGVFPSKAQHIRRFALKTDLAAAFDQRIAFCGEWHGREKNGWEIQAAFEQIPGPKAEARLWTVEYAEQQLRYRNSPGNNYFYNVQKPEFVGSGRPLPAAPDYTGYSILQFGLGHRFYIHLSPKRWRMILQPGLAMVRSRHYSSRDFTEVVWEESKERAVNTSIENRRTVFYRQTREMLRHDRWLTGITYSIGLLHIFKGGLSVEARFVPGLNLGKQAIPELRATTPRLRTMYGYGSILVGYAFG